MKHAYLLSDGRLEKVFGFTIKQSQIQIPVGMSIQEFYITDIIKLAYHYEPKVRDVLVVADNKGRGLVGRVNVHSKKRLYPGNVSPVMNPDIELDGDYIDELKNYLIEENEADRIVIARSKIFPAVKEDMRKLVGDTHLRAQFFS